MTSDRKPTRGRALSFIVLTLIFLGSYGYFVYAAAPSGGYTPGQTLNPDCTPGDADCFVVLPGGGSSVTADNGLTATGNNVQLGGTLAQDTVINTNDHSLSFGQATGPNSDIQITAGYFPAYSVGYASLSADNNTENASASVSDSSGSLNANLAYSDSSSLRTLSFGVNRNVIGMSSVAPNAPSANISTSIYIENYQGTIKMSGASNDNSWNTLWQSTDPTDLTGLTHDVLSVLTNDGEWTWNKYLSSRDDTGIDTPMNFLYTNGAGRVFSAPISFLGGGSGSESTTADNGLTLTGSNVQLGGMLTQDTVIDGDVNTYGLEMNNLSYAVLSVDNDFFIESNDRVLIRNGNNNIQVGGGIGLQLKTADNKPINMVFGSGSELSINGSTGTTGQVLTSNGSGMAPTWATVSGGSGSSLALQTNSTANGSQSLLNLIAGSNVSLTDNGSGNITINAANGAESTTADNGLTLTGSNVQLGGMLTQDTQIDQNGKDFLIGQQVPGAGYLVSTQGLTKVNGGPGTVTGYIAPGDEESARHITWVNGATNNYLHTLSGSGDTDFVTGGAIIATGYDMDNTASGSIFLRVYDSVNSTGTRIDLGSTSISLEFSSNSDLNINGSSGNAGYVLASNGDGLAPSWQDPAMLPSDERLKSNIMDLSSDALEKISNIRTVSYTLNSDTTNRTQIGFLAQDLEQYFPELVGMRPDGYKGVYYAQMTPVLVEAIRELNLQLTNIDDMAKANPIRDSFVTWLGNQANGIVKIVTDIIQAKQVQTDELCIKDVCMNRDQLYNMMQSSPAPVGTGQTPPVVVSEPGTPDDQIVDPNVPPVVVSEPETPDDQIIDPGVSPESAPETGSTPSSETTTE